MKSSLRKLFFSTLFLLVAYQPPAFTGCCLPPLCLDGWSAEARVAYFSPSHDRLRDIYSPHWVDYQFVVAREIFSNVEVWSSIGFIQRSGESTFVKEHTRFRVIPFGLGFKYYFPSCWDWKPYAGIGFNYRYLNIHNSSDYVQERVTQWKSGSTFQLGVKKFCCNGIFYDVFFDYILQNYRFSGHSSPYVKRNDIYFNGWKLGAGIGYAF